VTYTFCIKIEERLVQPRPQTAGHQRSTRTSSRHHLNTSTMTKMTSAHLTRRLRQLPRPQTRTAIAAAEASYKQHTNRQREHARMDSLSLRTQRLLTLPPRGRSHCELASRPRWSLLPAHNAGHTPPPP
jgi:hypothetical protein